MPEASEETLLDLDLAKTAIVTTKVTPQIHRLHGLAEEDIPLCIGNLKHYTLATSSLPIHRFHMKWISLTFSLMTNIDVKETMP